MKKPNKTLIVVIVFFIVLSIFIYKDSVHHKQQIEEKNKIIEQLQKQIEQDDVELNRRTEELKVCLDEASKKK